MPSSKISALTAATAPLTTDLHVLARGTTNRKITTANLFSEAISFTAFSALQSASNLIAGRWYRVTFCGYDLSQEVLVLATAPDQWSPRIIWLTTGSDPVECDTNALNADFNRYYDSQGNDYGRYFQAMAGLPPIGSGSTWQHNMVEDMSTCAFSGNFSNGYSVGSYYNSSTINFETCSVYYSRLTNYTDNFRTSSSTMTIDNCNFLDVSLNDSSKNCTILFENCNFKNVQISLDGDNVLIELVNLTLENCVLNIVEQVQFKYSSARNTSLDINTNAIVENLHITGESIASTYYEIDGTYQGQVLNNWAGTVVAIGATDAGASHRNGFSTVRMVIPSNNSGNNIPGTYDTGTETITLPDHSPVGVFLLANFDDAATYSPSIISAAFRYLQHKIEIGTVATFTTGKIDFDLSNTRAATPPNKILHYHGVTAKVGELKSPLDFVRLAARQNPDSLSDYIWTLEYGVHFD